MTSPDVRGNAFAVAEDVAHMYSHQIHPYNLLQSSPSSIGSLLTAHATMLLDEQTLTHTHVDHGYSAATALGSYLQDVADEVSQPYSRKKAVSDYGDVCSMVEPYLLKSIDDIRHERHNERRSDATIIVADDEPVGIVKNQGNRLLCAVRPHAKFLLGEAGIYFPYEQRTKKTKMEGVRVAEIADLEPVPARVSVFGADEQDRAAYEPHKFYGSRGSNYAKVWKRIRRYSSQVQTTSLNDIRRQIDEIYDNL